MKTLIVVASFVLLGGWMGQAPSTPPVKMGLWEVATTSMLAGAKQAPETAHVAKYRVCKTLDTYQNWFSGTSQEKCAFSNVVWTSRSYKADFACTDRGSTGHVEITFDSSTGTRSMVRINMPAGGNRPAMEVDSTSIGKYIGSDCGTVAPGKIQIIP
jgi:hypothetical protein